MVLKCLWDIDRWEILMKTTFESVLLSCHQFTHSSEKKNLSLHTNTHTLSACLPRQLNRLNNNIHKVYTLYTVCTHQSKQKRKEKKNWIKKSVNYKFFIFLSTAKLANILLYFLIDPILLYTQYICFHCEFILDDIIEYGKHNDEGFLLIGRRKEIIFSSIFFF